MCELYVTQKIEEGLGDIEAGRTIPHEQVKADGTRPPPLDPGYAKNLQMQLYKEFGIGNGHQLRLLLEQHHILDAL